MRPHLLVTAQRLLGVMGLVASGCDDDVEPAPVVTPVTATVSIEKRGDGPVAISSVPGANAGADMAAAAALNQLGRPSKSRWLPRCATSCLRGAQPQPAAAATAAGPSGTAGPGPGPASTALASCAPCCLLQQGYRLPDLRQPICCRRGVQGISLPLGRCREC